jgi:hypothetical protein
MQELAEDQRLFAESEAFRRATVEADRFAFDVELAAALARVFWWTFVVRCRCRKLKKSKIKFYAANNQIFILYLLGIEPSRFKSRSRLPCLFIICIFLTLSANESVLLMTTFSSASAALTPFPFVGAGGGRLSVNDYSTFSKWAAV